MLVHLQGVQVYAPLTHLRSDRTAATRWLQTVGLGGGGGLGQACLHVIGPRFTSQRPPCRGSRDPCHAPAPHAFFADDAAVGVGEEKEVDFKHLSEDEALSVLKVWSIICRCRRRHACRLCQHLGTVLLPGFWGPGRSPQCQPAGRQQHALQPHATPLPAAASAALPQLVSACLPRSSPALPLQATHKGLTSEEVAKRLAEYGPNKLPEGSRNAFLVYLGVGAEAAERC